MAVGPRAQGAAVPRAGLGAGGLLLVPGTLGAWFAHGAGVPA